MNTQILLEELFAIMETNNIKLRHEPLGGNGGGLCSVKGEKIFFIDTQSSSNETALKAAKVISNIVNIDEIYLKPQIRDFIESVNE